MSGARVVHVNMGIGRSRGHAPVSQSDGVGLPIASPALRVGRHDLLDRRPGGRRASGSPSRASSRSSAPWSPRCGRGSARLRPRRWRGWATGRVAARRAGRRRATPTAAVTACTSPDEERAHRQLGVVGVGLAGDVHRRLVHGLGRRGQRPREHRRLCDPGQHPHRPRGGRGDGGRLARRPRAPRSPTASSRRCSPATRPAATRVAARALPCMPCSPAPGTTTAGSSPTSASTTTRTRHRSWRGCCA